MKSASKMRRKIFNNPNPGTCIYCLGHFDNLQLTEDHIISKSLGGEWSILKAACNRCRKITNDGPSPSGYEQRALNTALIVPRLLMEIKRSRKSLPKSLPPVAIGDLTTEGNPDIFNTYLEAMNYPPYFSMIILKRPGKLVGLEQGADLIGFRLHLVSILSFREASRFKGVTTREAFDHTSFAVTLARYAYSYAVAKLGIEAFDGSEMRMLLCGERKDVYNFVGSASVKEKRNLPTTQLHYLHLAEHDSLVVVLVHLFASLGAYPYEVVVGSSLPSARETSIQVP